MKLRISYPPVAGAAWTVIAVLWILSGQTPAAGVTLQPGDILVADFNGAGPGRIVKVDPTTGVQTLVSWGGLLDEPYGLAFHPDGELYVTDRQPGVPPKIVAVDPSDASQRLVTSGGLLRDPHNLVVTAAGELLVVDHTAGVDGAIVKVDPYTGSQVILATGTHIYHPSGVDISAAGDIYTNSIAPGGLLYVVKIDPSTLVQTVVSPPQLNAWYEDLLYDDATGHLYVAELYHYNGIIRVDGGTGGQSILCSGWPFSDPYGLDWDLVGDIVVGDFHRRVLRVDPATGSTTIVSSGGLLVNPAGLAVVPESLAPLEVTIDIKPGSDPNCFNLNGHGVIPVGIHGSQTLDVGDIDFDSLLFDGLEVRVRGNRGPMCSFENLNGDPYLDLVCQFEDDPASWTAGEATARLNGELYDGTQIEGEDSICIVP